VGNPVAFEITSKEEILLNSVGLSQKGEGGEERGGKGKRDWGKMMTRDIRVHRDI
jgi:hypothetical protein